LSTNWPTVEQAIAVGLSVDRPIADIFLLSLFPKLGFLQYGYRPIPKQNCSITAKQFKVNFKYALIVDDESKLSSQQCRRFSVCNAT
jgi:hypothetical protein